MIGIIGATLFARLAQGLRGAGVALGLSLVAVPVCLAAPATESAWTKEPYSKVRLVSGAIAGQDGPKILAGVQIRLSPRWKTYWRSPGDSGVPPTFDWSGSKNLK